MTSGESKRPPRRKCRPRCDSCRAQPVLPSSSHFALRLRLLLPLLLPLRLRLRLRLRLPLALLLLLLDPLPLRVGDDAPA